MQAYGRHPEYTDDDLRRELVTAKDRLASAVADGAAAQRRVFEAVLDQVADRTSSP